MAKQSYKQFEASDLRLEHVFVMNASLNTPEQFPEGEMEYNFDVAPQLIPISIESGVLVRIFIKGRIQPKESPTEILPATYEIDLRFNFRVKDFDKYTSLKEQELDMSNDLCIAMLSLAYSTARGICISRFQSTVFGEFYLPIVTPDQLLKSSNLKARE
jgi:hypothetical protein